MFQTPAVVLSILIASVWAVLFYIVWGKSLRRLAAFWIAGVLGFLAGQWLAIALGSSLFMLGQIHLLEGNFLCLGALLLVKLIRF